MKKKFLIFPDSLGDIKMKIILFHLTKYGEIQVLDNENKR